MATNETKNVDEIRQKESRGEQLTPQEQQLLDDDNRKQDNARRSGQDQQ